MRYGRLRFCLLLLFSVLASLQVFSQTLYWEEAAQFSARPGRFPTSAHSADFSVIAWQEVSPNNDPSVAATGLININLAIKERGGPWQQRGIVAGPYTYLGTEPSILSLVIDNRGRIIIAAAAGGAQTEILISSDRGRTFSKQLLALGADNSVAPRLFVRADGGYLLFVTRGRGQALSIYYSRSDNGTTWTPFEFFTPENTLSLNFLPTHASIGRRDFVFFQSLIMGTESLSTFQLIYKTSDDGGRTWSQAVRFTSFTDPVMNATSPANSFDNQRPHLTRNGDNLFLVWERRYSQQTPQIYGATINQNGNIVGNVERINSAATSSASCQNPIGFVFNNTLAVVWFDNRGGSNRIIIAQRSGSEWQNTPLSGTGVEASFARPIVCHDGAYVFWQTTVRDTGRIVMLAPDSSAPSPTITALNFAPSRAGRLERPRVTWNIPYDTSGIRGFSYSWSQEQSAVPPEQIMEPNRGTTQNLTRELYASRDGEWYFSVRAQDLAGNWSAPSQIMYNRKGTPPPPVVIIQPQLDNNGFLTSNTFNMMWEPSVDPYTAGYTWNLQYLGANENANIASPPSNIMGSSTQTRFENQENGLWAFAISAIDQAGNIGNPSHITFRTNKYIPYTFVSYVNAQQDEQGVLSISLTGRGFTTGGTITSIVLQQTGKPDQTTTNYTIRSDREITGILFENMDEGNYRIKLIHSGRGPYTAEPFIPVKRTGTVKFGDFSNEWRPSWTIQNRGWFTFNPVIALGALLIILCALGTIAIIRGIGGIITEGALVKQEALAILTGDFMPMEKKQKIVQIQRRGSGLRRKLASFTIGLVLLVVIMISTPMYVIMTNTQQKTLLEGLWERSRVLLEGIASGTRTALPDAISSKGDRGVLDLMYLPAQSSALPEANYITITGYGIDSIHTDSVWASNDPALEEKIDTSELRRGVSRITDDLGSLYDEITKDFNSKAQLEGGDISQNIRDLYREGMIIALDISPEGERKRADIQVTITAQEVRLNNILSEIAGDIGSYPEFSTTHLPSDGNRTFIFYKPIMYRLNADNNFYRGMVRMEVSLDSIVERLYNEQLTILTTIGIVGFIVLLIGTIGAFVFAALMIRPIRKLVKHIEMIRDTDDKTKLAGVEILIKTKDEISMLGNTINDMTHGLVKAAQAASDLSIGKEIQKKFIPLDVDNHGNKQSSGFKKTPNLNFFGYYEGAKGVSGDYFDYRDLDGRYYAIIKCDVAGKGIPAALIMIQVATMFLNYFKQWKPNAKGMHIEEVVYQINDFIETLGFKGRFAAFTLCLFDSATGIVRFCNAGDNVVRFYDQSEGTIKTITLPQTPATGVLPNFMIETTGGYSVQTVQIDKGDILFLYTDGIEEAKRRFRDLNFKEILCTEGPTDTPHENHSSGQADEEMGPDRVEAIINAVMAGAVYTLKKYHNPEGDTELQFDFSTCEGRVEDVIMAMVSVEKMFRIYKPEKAGEDSRVLVDKKVDEFLKGHFLQYRKYCAHTQEHHDNPAYMYYTHVMEDEQYDDLTILGIKRKIDK